MQDLRIEFLANHEEIFPRLAALFQEEWAPYYGPGGPGNAEEDLRRSCGISELPVGLVAFLGDELCGTVALKNESIDTHPHLGPWIAALVVLPEFRNRGVEAKLIEAAVEAAKKLNHEAVYFGAGAKDDFFDRSEWEFVDRVRYLVGEGAIYRKYL